MLCGELYHFRLRAGQASHDLQQATTADQNSAESEIPCLKIAFASSKDTVLDVVQAHLKSKQ